MLTKRIIPCLDVKDGRVVKGVNFMGLQDAGDPVKLGKSYDEQNADELVFLDITASMEKRNTVAQLARSLAKEIFIPLTIGGGIGSVEDISTILESGADKIAINTAALEDPDLINESSKNFGAQCIVVAVDVKRTGDFWPVFSHGGMRATDRNAEEWVQEVVDRGAGEILLTSIDRDGEQSGFDCELMKRVSLNVSVPVIASGGGGTLEHFSEVVNEGKADGVLAASVFHNNILSIKDIKEHLRNQNIPVRIK